MRGPNQVAFTFDHEKWIRIDCCTEIYMYVPFRDFALGNINMVWKNTNLADPTRNLDGPPGVQASQISKLQTCFKNYSYDQ